MFQTCPEEVEDKDDQTQLMWSFEKHFTRVREEPQDPAPTYEVWKICGQNKCTSDPIFVCTENSAQWHV